MLQSSKYHDAASFWDTLHDQERFRPTYPNENVVRFLMRTRPRGPRRGHPARALDIGVGGGRHTHLLCELGFETIGVDISECGLRHTADMLARRGFHPRLVRATMTDLPFGSHEIDTAISFGVFYYGTRADMQRAINELYRVLRPAGTAFVVLRTPNDYRHGKGLKLETGTYLLRIQDTNECGSVQHFVSEDDLGSYFAEFERVEFERTETTFANRQAVNSDWLISATK